MEKHIKLTYTQRVTTTTTTTITPTRCRPTTNGEEKEKKKKKEDERQGGRTFEVKFLRKEKNMRRCLRESPSLVARKYEQVQHTRERERECYRGPTGSPHNTRTHTHTHTQYPHHSGNIKTNIKINHKGDL